MPVLDMSPSGLPLFSSNTGSGVGGALHPMGLLPPGTAQHPGMTDTAGIAGYESARMHRVSPLPFENHRWIYVALAGVLVGIIVLLAISILDTEPDVVPLLRPVPPGPTQPAMPAAAAVSGPSGQSNEASHGSGSQSGGTREPADVKPAPAPPPPPAPPTPPSITIRVTSTPSGADVLLAGTPIGTTPLEIPIPKRKAGFAQLTVHRARYLDVTAMIDLGVDYTNHIKLTALGDDSAPRPPIRERPSPPREKPRVSPPPPAIKKCQPPDRINPFDTSCGGKACPPCSA
jgi:hypothetical protein